MTTRCTRLARILATGTLALSLQATTLGAQLDAAFSLSTGAGPADLTVQFDDLSSGSPVNWIWNFGDGQSQAGTPTATHVYTQPGTYDVSLTAFGAGFQIDTETLVGAITVGPAQIVPDFGFVADQGPVGAQFTPTNLTSSTTAAISFSWDFGDGTPPQSGSAPAHQYTAPGSYDVTLTVLHDGQQHSLTQPGAVSVQAVDLQATFQHSLPTAGDLPLAVSFQHAGQGVTPTAYHWDFHGAVTTSFEQASAEVSFGLPGVYDVSLTVWYFDQQDTFVLPDLLQVGAVPFEVDLTVVGPAAGPRPHTVTLQAPSLVGPAPDFYTWDFGDGHLSSSFGDSLVHTYETEGQFDVSVRATYLGLESEVAVGQAVHVGPSDTWELLEHNAGPAGAFVYADRVALDGERFAVHEYDPFASRVRLHERAADGTWPVTATVVPALGGGLPGLPGDLDLDGERLLVGESHPVPGRAQLFERQPDGSWTSAAQLLSGAGGADQFGFSVSLDGDLAAVGVPGIGGSFGATGEVFVYERQPDGAWPLQIRFQSPPDCQYFGSAVTLHDGRLAMGGLGVVRTAVRQLDGSWQLAPDLLPPRSVVELTFGPQLALHGEHLALVVDDDDADRDVVMTYAWQAGQWLPSQVLTPPDLSENPDLGGVELTGERLVYSGRSQLGNKGLVYIHDRLPDGSWDSGRSLAASDGAFADEFGYDHSVDGARLLVSSLRHVHAGGQPAAPDDGAAYLFERVVQPDLGVGGPAGVRLSVSGGDLTGTAAQATLWVSEAPASAAVVLVAGLSVFDPPLFAKGGLLLPTPDLLLSGLSTSPAGGLFMPLVAPDGVPAEVVIQAVVLQGQGAAAFSNAVAVTLDL